MWCTCVLPAYQVMVSNWRYLYYSRCRCGSVSDSAELGVRRFQAAAGAQLKQLFANLQMLDEAHFHSCLLQCALPYILGHALTLSGELICG